jgi:hypothetical protein
MTPGVSRGLAACAFEILQAAAVRLGEGTERAAHFNVPLEQITARRADLAAQPLRSPRSRRWCQSVGDGLAW